MPDQCQTHSTGEGPICPNCGTEYTADDEIYYDEYGFSNDCAECGVKLHIQPYTETSWTTTIVDDA